MSAKAEQFKVSETAFLCDFLAERFPQASGTRVKKMIILGNIRVNSNIIRNPAFRLCQGDEVTYQRPVILPGGKLPFRVVFEDHCLIVVEKPAGLLTYGEKGSAGTSVYRELKNYYSRQSRDKAELFVVHRLDREVSGLLVFAKSLQIQEVLKAGRHEFTKK